MNFKELFLQVERGKRERFSRGERFIRGEREREIQKGEREIQ